MFRENKSRTFVCKEDKEEGTSKGEGRDEATTKKTKTC
jgi:hypothetical protein